MLALTRVESDIREVLVDVARKQELTHYEAIAPIAGLDMTNPDHRTKIGEMLGDISSFEHQYGRPMLSAVVIHKGGSEPGQGFFKCAADLGLFNGQTADQRLAFFARELGRLYDYWGKAHVEIERIRCGDCLHHPAAAERDEQKEAARQLEEANPGFCRHFLPEWWEAKGFTRAWGDASVMNWPHLVVLRRGEDAWGSY